MKKLVIVGNGFDLAHGLPTSYSDFINFFWSSLENRYNDDIIKRTVHVNQGYKDFLTYGDKKTTCFNDLLKKIKSFASDNSCTLSNDFELLNPKRLGGGIIFSFKNEFFRLITLAAVHDWVDIENKYYEILKNLVKNESPAHRIYKFDILRLNSEFDDVKTLLEDYLTTELEEKNVSFNDYNNENEILKLFHVRPLYLEQRSDHSIFNEFPPEDRKRLIEYDNEVLQADQQSFWEKGKNLTETLFLNFNYTNTVEFYVNNINGMSKQHGSAEYIQIHGKINSKDNNLNFGFGDEMDEDYKLIERKNDNAFLKNIKSFQYLHTTNYRRLLNWIEINKFQVFIFGHSCGLSDRTLLNTIFESSNCRSIKIFYHESNDKNNYTELTQNISRHFNKKALMRTKIVDRTLCTQLPQSIRLKKK